MKNSVFEVLKKYKNNKFINNSEEIKFYNKYCEVLYDNNNFVKYTEINDLFDVVKSNIIIRSILNKNTIDKIIKEEISNHDFNTVEEIQNNIKNRFFNLPYMKYEDFKIYIPFFNISTNNIYSNEFFKLKEVPYNDLMKNYIYFLIDPFETYKLNIFESNFTELVKIYSDNTSSAYYHFNLRTIFIINDQGFIDNTIYLFDKKMKYVDTTNIVERIKPAIRAYYKNDAAEFIYSLNEEKLISHKVFRKLCKIKKI